MEDPTGRIEFVVFPRTFVQYQQFLTDDNIVIMDGKLDMRRDQIQFAVNSVKSVSLDSMIENAKEAGVFDEKENVLRKQKSLTTDKKPVVIEEPKKSLPQTESDDWKENPFIIELPESATTETLQRLKSLLLENQGEGSQAIHDGHFNVKDDRVDLSSSKSTQSRFSMHCGTGHGDLRVGFQCTGQQPADYRGIVND